MSLDIVVHNGICMDGQETDGGMDVSSAQDPPLMSVRPPDLTIIVVSWNTRDLLADCLSSVRRWYGGVSYQLIVVDNASADGSADMVARDFPEVTLIRNAANLGFVKANNQAASLALGRVFLLLNSDTKVLDAGVAEIIEFLDANPGVGAVTGKVLNADGSFQRPFRRFPAPVGAYFRHTLRLIVGLDTPFHRRYMLQAINPDTEAVLDGWITGAYLFVRREFLHQGTIFDQDSFMFYEDTMLCLRIRQAGARIAYLPIAPIVHYGGESTKHVKALTMYNSFISSVEFFRKTRGARIASLYHTAVVGTWRLFGVLFSILGRLGIPRCLDKNLLFQELSAFAVAHGAENRS